MQAVDAGVANADNTQDPDREKKEAVTKKFMREFKQARKFDKEIRNQINKDRKYASGQAQILWAVSTNLIGSIIDILTAALYARDPDVSVSKTEQAENEPDDASGQAPASQDERETELFARTLELVISKLWKRAKLKKYMRRIVRSVLSTGQGWLKVLPVVYTEPNPEMQNQFNTLQDNIKRFDALRTALAEGQSLTGATLSNDDLLAAQEALQMQVDALAEKLEVMTCDAISIDVVKPEDMQISTDVELLEDHLEANWNTQLIYVPQDEVKVRFPNITDADFKTMDLFYRAKPKNMNAGDGNKEQADFEDVVYPTNADGEQYSTEKPNDESIPFARVLEQWNHDDNHIHTYISGIKVPVKDPYQLKWATSRFFPFFYFSIYEVDGERAPQSLSSRLAKLQDEYSTTRSNFRLSRERSITGFLFDAGSVDDTQAAKIKSGLREEMIPVKLPNDGKSKLSEMFVAKPVSKIDPRLYETTPIIQDMERISGIQEAEQAAVMVEKTATEAEIQQAGYTARTQAARDVIETVLTDLAHYTAEIALQVIQPKDAQRMAGPFAFWPAGMAREDILTMVEVSIAAGTTGKPRNKGDRDAWGVIMPLIQEAQEKIAELQQQPGGQPLANALKALVAETMLRMGDDTDAERFFPVPPQTPPQPQEPQPEVKISLTGKLPSTDAEMLAGLPPSPAAIAADVKDATPDAGPPGAPGAPSPARADHQGAPGGSAPQ